MIRVRTASRLHFGMLRLGPDDPERPRTFGGVGMMVDAPGLRLSVRPAATWSAEGPLAERALAFARRVAASVELGTITPHHLEIEAAPPEHAGLGTGTQLGLAVARALALAAEKTEVGFAVLAEAVERGQRSALGVHGFTHGGFLVEGGKRARQALAPLVARVDFPETWAVLLAMPPGRGLHDDAERSAFRQMGQSGADLPTDLLCRLVLLGMLPALAERDLDTFGEALYEFNRRVGEAFAPAQGGVYAGARADELVRYLRGQGIRGVAQSSWGPTICAVCSDGDEAASLGRQLRHRFALDAERIIIARPCNRGAEVSTE